MFFAIAHTGVGKGADRDRLREAEADRAARAAKAAKKRAGAPRVPPQAGHGSRSVGAESRRQDDRRVA